VPLESSPICFRLSLEDRDLLDMVAKHRKLSVSAFVRDAAIKEAREVLRDQEVALLEEYKAENDRLARELQARTQRVADWVQPNQAESRPRRTKGTRAATTSRRHSPSTKDDGV
jgi:uncharacterized protein (DUF1778 family)